MRAEFKLASVEGLLKALQGFIKDDTEKFNDPMFPDYLKDYYRGKIAANKIVVDVLLEIGIGKEE